MQHREEGCPQTLPVSFVGTLSHSTVLEQLTSCNYLQEVSAGLGHIVAGQVLIAEVGCVVCAQWLAFMVLEAHSLRKFNAFLLSD